MHLILGGRYMGKRAYAERTYGPFASVYDMEAREPESMTSSGLIVNIHEGVKTLMKKGEKPLDFFLQRMDILSSSVITGDEIGGGIVPMDEFSRKWRDETGLLYQALAEEAEIVDRIFAGLVLRLKG